MRLNLQCANSGEPCWNEGALRAYAESQSNKELHSDGPSVAIGGISCKGCMVNELGYGTFCSAQLDVARTVDQDITDIPGFRMIQPGSGKDPRDSLDLTKQIA